MELLTKAMKHYYTDCIIFGGGVCGVWIDAILTENGYHTCLLEKDKIGGEQTLLSQGIIHKGMKYLLGGSTPKIANLLLASTKIWEESFAGSYQVDLQKTEIYTNKQLVWNENNLFSSFFAKSSQQAFRSEIQKLNSSEIPKWLTHRPKNIFWLREKVINAHSMMKNFYQKYKKHYYQYSLEKENFSLEKQKDWVGLKLPKENILLWTKKIILAAGKGNEKLAKIFNIPYKMQLRSLSMLVVEHNEPLSIYGHCITTSSKPLFTISSHPKSSGKIVWYLGGKIAEVQKGQTQDFQKTSDLLQKNIRINLQKAHWKSIVVQRAEPYQKNTILPEKPYIKDHQNVIVCAPVKLAFAPLIAIETHKILQKNNILPCFFEKKKLPFLKAKLAHSFYE